MIKPTHPQRPTLALKDASRLAYALAMDISPLPLSVEELVWILESYLDEARDEGRNDALSDDVNLVDLTALAREIC